MTQAETGGVGNDLLVGGNDNDFLGGDAGRNFLLGLGGADALFLRGDANELAIGGDDVVDAKDNNADSISCGAGTDTVRVDEEDAEAGDCENVVG